MSGTNKDWRNTVCDRDSNVYLIVIVLVKTKGRHILIGKVKTELKWRFSGSTLTTNSNFNHLVGRSGLAVIVYFMAVVLVAIVLVTVVCGWYGFGHHRPSCGHRGIILRAAIIAMAVVVCGHHGFGHHQGSHSFTEKNPVLFQDPMKIFQDLFGAR